MKTAFVNNRQIVIDDLLMNHYSVSKRKQGEVTLEKEGIKYHQFF